MPINKTADQANGAPRYAILDNKTANGEAMYGNTTANAFLSGATVGVFGVDTTEIGISGNTVLSFNIISGGSGYANGDLVKVVGATTNAAANISTNSTGGITSITISNNGAGVVPTANLSVTNSTSGATAGSGANLMFRLGEGKKVPHTGWVKRTEFSGGRAGRVQYEVMVAGGITSDGSDDTLFPDS